MKLNVDQQKDTWIAKQMIIPFKRIDDIHTLVWTHKIHFGPTYRLIIVESIVYIP